MGRFSIDNNLSERMVRPVAIGRKNYLFLGSDNGGTAAAVLYSVLASAKANQVEPFAYVATCSSSYRAIRRLRPRRYCRTLGWRPTRNLAGAGRGSWATGWCNTEKLIIE